MGFLKNIVDSVLITALFYLGLGFLTVVHGANIPEIGFTPMAVVTLIIYFMAQVTNYRL